jgi:hypothetical protein
MLLQTNSYIVPKEKRAEHARLMRRFRQILNSLGCDNFEIYEQVGANWSSGQSTGRCVQIMRFRDRKHQLAVQNAERSDPAAQKLIAEFCDLINYPYQQQQGQFAVGFYSSVLPVAPARGQEEAPAAAEEEAAPTDTQETLQAETFVDETSDPTEDSNDFPSEAPAVPADSDEPQQPLSLVAAEANVSTEEAPEGEILSDELFPEDASAELSTPGEEPKDPLADPDRDRDLADLDAELGIDDDDEISRMAQELAADDKPRRPPPPLHRPENGSH